MRVVRSISALARFADLFERSESREQARKYLRGLLTEAERKNSWQVAEAVGDRIPDRMQRLLYRVPWDAEAARWSREYRQVHADAFPIDRSELMRPERVKLKPAAAEQKKSHVRFK